MSPRRVRVIRWRCDKCRECIATVEDGWWRPATETTPVEFSDEGRQVPSREGKRRRARIARYEDVNVFDPETERYFIDAALPEQLSPQRLAGVPRDAVLYGLCPNHGVRVVRLADVRRKLRR